jgi:hypothetical protein
MRERYLLGATAVPFVVAALMGGPAQVPGDVVTTFKDPAIIESSGLAVIYGLFVTTNDSGDSGRVFVVDPASGATVGVTHWSDDPVDVEALAPAADGDVWVGDIGDNQAARDSISVARVPVGRGDTDVDPTSYVLTFPGGPRDAESLLADPATGRLYVVSKGVFGGTVYAAPRRLSPDQPNRLTEVGPVLGIATDAAFFPDGRHIIVRDYSSAAVYTFPDLTEVGRFDLPQQQQGEGIAVAADGTVYASSEGLHAPVLRIALPEKVLRALEASSPSPSTTAPQPSETASAVSGSGEGTEQPGNETGQRSAWGWALGGLLGLGIVLVLVRSLRPR